MPECSGSNSTQQPRHHALAQWLRETQEAFNVRGIRFIRDIAFCLNGEIDAASATVTGEWDKVSSPEIVDGLLTRGYSCRLTFQAHVK